MRFLISYVWLNVSFDLTSLILMSLTVYPTAAAASSNLSCYTRRHFSFLCTCVMGSNAVSCCLCLRRKGKSTRIQRKLNPDNPRHAAAIAASESIAVSNVNKMKIYHVCETCRKNLPEVLSLPPSVPNTVSLMYVFCCATNPWTVQER